ncbi:FxLYD domain-containing protein [Halomarina salina]|uniref:FxLYD domain-containing protein n=1 Tax=Halomarina salina TaxID=1872699 RepID=A0ABD5RIA9_9EURY|nr:FxLYD domain-containing protein [Halomarina salina]
MNRRRYLALTGALTTTVLAGCSGGGGSGGTTDGGADTADSTTQASSGTENDIATEQVTETETIQSETETTTEEAPETESGAASLDIGDKEEISVNTEGDIASAVGGAPVTNSGSTSTGELTVSATFFDGNGDELTTETHTIAALPAGKTWYSFVILIGEDAEAAEDYELEYDYEETPPNFTTEGLTEVESSSENQDNKLTISGEVRNDTEGELSDLTATAFLYLDGAQKEILSTLDDSTQSLPAGETWTYELTTQGVGNIAGDEVRYSYSSS